MKIIPVLFVCAVLFSCSPSKTEIYQWRGDNRKGIFDEKNLLKSWPENGPEEIWHAENIGNGYGSPTVTGKEIFITGETDSIAWLYCFDLNGTLLWKQNSGQEWARHYPGSRSAPTVAGNQVYTCTGMGIVTCTNRKTGEVKWSKNMATDLGGTLPMHGFSEAPVIDGDKVFCTPGGEKNNVVALNRFTGEMIWSCKGMGDRMAYNPGNIIQHAGRKLLVTFTAYHLLGIDAETGELLWTHLQDNTSPEQREPGVGDSHCNNVIYEDGYIYYAAGDGNCGVKLQLSEDGSAITEIWRNPDLDSYMSSFVKLDGYLYGCGTRKKDLKSFRSETGETVDSLKAGTGAVIAAGNMLYYYNWGGELSLLSCENGKLEKQSSFKITRGSKEHFSHPVIQNGILYQRHGNTLMAFDIRKRKQ